MGLTDVFFLSFLNTARNRHGSTIRGFLGVGTDVDRASPNNWLDDTIWIKAAYHSWRVPLPVNSNWWILFAHDPDVVRFAFFSLSLSHSFL